MSTSDSPKAARRSRRRPRPSSSHGGTDVGLAETLQRALSVTTNWDANGRIDAILERRQREGLPPNVDPPRPGAGQTTNAVTATGTSDELSEARADLFGRPPRDVTRTEERLLALQLEVRKLPRSERRALTEAMTKHPLLLVNCPHAKQFVLDQPPGAAAGESGDDDDEDNNDDGFFDAAAAARRLASYWEARWSLLGTEAWDSPGTFPDPGVEDYRIYYERTRAVLDDPRSDERSRRDAERMITIIQERKIDAMDAYLDEMEEENREDYNPEDHDDDLAAEAVLNMWALDMARESSDELKLRFLRVENMIEAGAARRLARYWETGLRLFGPSLMQSKTTTLEAIEDDCPELFRCHQLRLMPEKDDFGRSILVWRQIVSKEGQEGGSGGDLLSAEEGRMSHEHHYAKVFWYVIHAAMERESCLRNGFVVICDLRIRYPSGDLDLTYYRKHHWACVNVLNCVPVKLRAVHCVLGSDFMGLRRNVLIRAVQCILSVSVRRRIAVHGGTTEEVLDKLAAFGMGAEKLPTDLGGDVGAEHFERWMMGRRAAGI